MVAYTLESDSTLLCIGLKMEAKLLLRKSPLFGASAGVCWDVEGKVVNGLMEAFSSLYVSGGFSLLCI